MWEYIIEERYIGAPGRKLEPPSQYDSHTGWDPEQPDTHWELFHVAPTFRDNYVLTTWRRKTAEAIGD